MPVIRRIDRYELLEQIGTGGMAVVYRGRDTMLHREVAVKVLHPHLAERAESRARFSREARAVARLSHPGIVEIFDYGGETAEAGWIVTEFVRGRTLRAFADEVGFGYPEIGVLVGRALADALAHAHSAGVIHRDLKPENVLLAEEAGKRAVKLADFGIARILASDDRMTMTGALVGSPNHMAPEIISGNEADSRSDVFSLGTIVYWLATGRMPFSAPNPTATLRRIIQGDFEDSGAVSPFVSDRLARAIRRALSLEPSGRQSTAAELRDELDEVLAEAGLEEPESELAAFLADPDGYRRAFPPRVVEALTRRGEEALGRGAAARALAFFSRALVYQPDNPRVLGHLRRIERRARVRRAGRAAAVLLAVATAAALGWAKLRHGAELGMTKRPEPATAGSAPRATQPDVALPLPLSPAGGEGQGEGAPTPKAMPLTPALSPQAGRGSRPDESYSAPGRADAASGRRPSPVEVAVHVRPYAQKAFLDGIEIARSVQEVTFTIAPGRKHVIQIEHSCCRPYIRQIDSAEAASNPELRVPLEPKPALLRVEGDPATRVYVGDHLLGTAGDSQRSPLPLRIPPGDNPYEGQVEVQLELQGKGTVTAPLKIRAGTEVVVASPLKEVP